MRVTISDYISANKEALLALTSINATNQADWLIAYKSLYLNLTYADTDLPRLADSNFEGQYFEHIDKFCYTYEQLSSMIDAKGKVS